MMIERAMSRALRLVFASTLATGMHGAMAQTDDAAIQRVEVTGSSIKRLAS